MKFVNSLCKNIHFYVNLKRKKTRNIFLLFLITFILLNNIDNYSNCSELKSTSTSKLKMTMKTKGDIPRFCDRESTPISIKFGHSNKKKGQDYNTGTSSNKLIITNNTNINNTVIYIELIYNFLISYLILYLLSYLKWYEQMYIVIYDYINRTFFGFIDLRKENDKLICLEKTLSDKAINIAEGEGN